MSISSFLKTSKCVVRLIKPLSRIDSCRNRPLTGRQRWSNEIIDSYSRYFSCLLVYRRKRVMLAKMSRWAIRLRGASQPERSICNGVGESDPFKTHHHSSGPLAKIPVIPMDLIVVNGRNSARGHSHGNSATSLACAACPQGSEFKVEPRSIWNSLFLLN